MHFQTAICERLNVPALCLTGDVRSREGEESEAKEITLLCNAFGLGPHPDDEDLADEVRW